MPPAFAALEVRVNAACMAALANAEEVLPDASVVAGLLEDAAIPGGALDVMPAYRRVFTAATDDLAGLEIGDLLTAGDVEYAVVAIEPDGTGLTVLGLK